MDLHSTLSLLVAMLVLAVIPGPAVFAVITRSMAFGFSHGLFTTIGIVCGDFVFIALVIFGLSAIAEHMSSVFIVIKYLGGAYLIWLGISLIRSKPESIQLEKVTESTFTSSFLTGLLLTLGNPKPILFYIGFFPAFVDLTKLSLVDSGIIFIVTIVAIGGCNLVYSYLGQKASSMIKNTKAKRKMNLGVGSMMIGTGSYLISRN